jgi:hypothetical protein
MDPSALESVSRSLESSLDFWGLMLLVATLLVVIGLVVEYWHEVGELWEHVRWPMAAFPWDKVVALSGGILVTIGVFGELFVTYKASRVETKLRENNHKIEESLNISAAEAAKAADRARNLANTAESTAGSALHMSNEANAAASNARTSAKTANEIAGDAKTSAQSAARAVETIERNITEEHAKRVELEQAVRPRTIDMITVDGESTVDALKPFKGWQATIKSISDWEARRAANSLADRFRNAGWSASTEVAEGNPEDFIDGVIVAQYQAPHNILATAEQDEAGYRLEDISRGTTKEVVAWLKANGWESIVWAPSQHGELKPKEILIKVGYKPTGYFEDEVLKRTLLRMQQQLKYPDRDRVEQIRSQLEKIRRKWEAVELRNHPPNKP